MSDEQDPDDIIHQFPRALHTQEDVLQGLHVVAFGLLHGVVAPTRAEPIRRTLETASKTIAMRDTVKNNKDRPTVNNHIQVQALVAATNPSARQIAHAQQDDFLDALGPTTFDHIPLALSEPLPDPAPPPATSNAPLPEHIRRVVEGREEMAAGKSALLASLTPGARARRPQ